MRDRWKRESARADLAELLLRVCEELVRTPLETIDTAIVSALAAVGRAFDLDRVVTVEFSADGAMTLLTHEWRSEELIDREPSVMELLTSALPNYNEALFARFVPVDIPDVDQLPEAWAGEREYFSARGIRASYAIPYSLGDDRVGCLVFDSSRSARDWSHSGAVAGVLAGTIGGVLAAKRRNTALSESERRHRQLANQSTDTIMVLLPGGFISYASPAAVRLFGYEPAEMIGHHWSEFVPPEEAQSLHLRESVHEMHEHRVTRRDGTTLWVESSWMQRFDPVTGERIEAQGTIRDVDARRRAELRLANRVELEKLILNASSGFLEIGTEQVDAKIDETLCKIGGFLNVDRAFVIRIDPATGRLHAPNRWTLSPDDAEPSVLERAPSTVTARWLLRLAHNELVQIDESTESPRPDELVVLASRGVRAAMLLPMRTLTNLAGVLVFESTSRAQALDDDQITLLRIVAELFTNALELRRRSDELRQSEERFRLLALNSSDLIARIDVDGYLRYVSPVVRSLLGYVAEDLVGTHLFRYVERDDHHLLMRCGEILTSGAVPERVELRLRAADGTPIWSEASFQGVFDERTGRLLEIQAAVRDVRERKRNQDLLERQANHDALTDLPNRRHFIQQLTEAVADLAINPGLLATFFIDLDGFKSVNDTAGHDVGDAVLVAVGERIRMCVRPSDVVARHGGDEFTVLCQGVDDELVAAKVASRLVTSLRRPFDIEGHHLQIGASVGVALAHDETVDAQSLVRAADAAMYTAKQKGKGQWVLAALR